MEPDIQSEKKEKLEILESQIRECYGKVVYSHKTHEKCSDILNERLSNIKLWQIILSAITTSGFLAKTLGAGDFSIIIGLIIAVILLVLNAYTKKYDLGEISQKHKQAANELWKIREDYLSLITDIHIADKTLNEFIKIRDLIEDRLYKIYDGAPATNVRGYKKAQESLKKLEEMTFSDSEIDSLLPQKLRKTSS